MTEELHCYENAKAERVNGILKQEYYLGGSFRTKRQAVGAVDQAVYLYNTRRPHLALKYKTPEAAHRELKKVA
jgi:transposase InsO family protein